MIENPLIERRNRLLGSKTPVFYENPVHIVRGEGVWLYDSDGQRYLDCYNNVPSVGHCHPAVVDALCAQVRTLNVHTRYLHENILDYAEQLLAKFDESLDRVMFVCTGSEANDQALRIARMHTGKRGFICSNATYHGNTEAVIQLSTIFGSSDTSSEDIRMVDWPDSYRTINGLSGDALYDAYAKQLSEAIGSLEDSGVGVAGMIVCPIFANEGLPVDPHLYLQRVMPLIREAGGLYIADEVQAGFGRTGKWWGPTDSGLIPDIVTLGKPMDAGHPLAGLVTRNDLMHEFQEKEGYCNTFGGNPVYCAVGLAVLNVLEGEGLIENAAVVGAYVMKKFTELQSRFDFIGDVRGNGLFFGMDLVSDRAQKTADARLARRFVNTMRDKGILMGNIGEYGNILKLRPPLCFSKENADMLVATLDEVFSAG